MFGFLKNFFSGFKKKKDGAGQKAVGGQNPAERKPPKYFYSKKLDPLHVKGLNKAIRTNAKAGGHKVTLKYQKANGELVTRQVTPYTAKGKNIMVGFDHHRGALRSFRVDRIQKMS